MQYCRQYCLHASAQALTAKATLADHITRQHCLCFSWLGDVGLLSVLCFVVQEFESGAARTCLWFCASGHPSRPGSALLLVGFGRAWILHGVL